MTSIGLMLFHLLMTPYVALLIAIHVFILAIYRYYISFIEFPCLSVADGLRVVYISCT